MSSESQRHSEEKRPASCKFVELHVLFVPNDQWNVKLNKVPIEAIENFVSAGFIRVYPDVTLKALRNKLSSLLGTEGSMDKFFYLKCLGHSLALVKSKQERDVKVKTFAPPFAPQPELYLLRVIESDSSVRSQSLTPETSSNLSENSYYPFKSSIQQPGPKEPAKFPKIQKCSNEILSTPENDNEDEGQSYSSSEADNPEKSCTTKLKWVEMESCLRKPQLKPSPGINVLQECKTDSAPTIMPPKEQTSRKLREYNKSQAARDSGVVLEDRHSGFSLRDWHGKSKESRAVINTTKPKIKEGSSPVVLSHSLQSTSPVPGGNESVTTEKAIESPSFMANKQELIEEIKLVREERKQLEWVRQELLRKGKDLLAQNRHRRNQARDSCKKKYFETKKATAPLEDDLRNARQELETVYCKLLHQLYARENRSKPKRQGRSSVKNELIIQIITECYEIDDLKRRVEDAKMKLLTEVKLRKQAATELRALKAELAQKKSQSAHPRPVTYFGFGNTTWDKAHNQSSSI